MRYGRTEVVTRGYARLHGIMEAGFFVGYQERAVLAKIRQPEGRGYGCRCVTGLSGSRACLKNHPRHLHAPLSERFAPNSVNVARYASLIRYKSPTK